MSITKMKLMGITWGECKDLRLTGQLIPLETPVELIFKKPVDQALVNQVLQALQAKQVLTLTGEAGVKTLAGPNELANQQPKTAPDPGIESATSTDQVEEDKPGEHLQVVDETQDFDPETVGSAVAEHLASNTKVDQAAPNLNVPSALPSQGHPEPFTSTDFEQQPDQAAISPKTTTFDASGKEIDSDNGDNEGPDNPDNDLFGQYS
ncbi:hypothetical protein [Lactiplantibacillus plantarum]|uniref:hypothetical protein n=1 Tax=Lactiplantibacillus plantarum TaxID=1590 RepID=UPI000FF3FEA3|nr:hypothetical protein [Lactiplantibacillus plantarum]RWZ42846.1 hypothetical protein EQG58_15605 [Lactiplantibacillus plantarum]